MASAVNVMHRLWGQALDLLFPPSCVGCGAEGALLCESCRASLPWLQGPCCPTCARPLEAGGVCQSCLRYPLQHIDGIRAAFHMRGVAREMVHRLKYDNLRSLAPLMASLMMESMEDDLAADIVVPVPLHPRRERQRGYNQAFLLARGVARHTDLALATKALRRWKNTPAQVELEGMEARRANVEGVFQARVPLSDMRVLLVDDVCTTGATLEACALALKEKGAVAVQGLVFAR